MYLHSSRINEINQHCGLVFSILVEKLSKLRDEWNDIFTAYEFIKSMLEKFQYLEDKFSEIFWLEFSPNLSTTILNNKLIIAVLKNELLKIIDSVRVICRAATFAGTRSLS